MSFSMLYFSSACVCKERPRRCQSFLGVDHFSGRRAQWQAAWVLPGRRETMTATRADRPACTGGCFRRQTGSGSCLSKAPTATGCRTAAQPRCVRVVHSKQRPCMRRSRSVCACRWAQHHGKPHCPWQPGKHARDAAEQEAVRHLRPGLV